MSDFKLIFLFLITGISYAFAQFNPQVAERSLVKVLVAENGSNRIVICSGFIWKKKSWIVTSLHAMRNDGIIKIVYSGEDIREARIIKVHKDADLVLLQTNIEINPLSKPVSPLTSSYEGEMLFGEKIYALGYNGGSKGNQTQALEKGYANPETLAYLVREEDREALKLVGFPSISIPIYFLSGSLLPGFSGCPVYNQKGVLIGVGDGGLEQGTMNVSWCIPASHLKILENSVETLLPINLKQIEQQYSAGVFIELPRENATNSNQQIDIKQVEELVDKKYKSFSHGDLQFFQTKTRNFKDLKSSAASTLVLMEPLYSITNRMLSSDKNKLSVENSIENIKDVGKIVSGINKNGNKSHAKNSMENTVQEFRYHDIILNDDVLNFDIYNEINYGVTIAIPRESLLTFDEKFQLTGTDLSRIPQGKYFNLLYYSVKYRSDLIKEITATLNNKFGKECKGFVEDTGYHTIFKLSEDWNMDLLFFNGVQVYNTSELGAVTTRLYLSVVSNRTTAICSVGICYVPEDRPEIKAAFEKGINCLKKQDRNSELCDYFETMMQIVAATHMTTRSSTY
ncbi:MAG: serine protease [Chitinophagales bacterium]